MNSRLKSRTWEHIWMPTRPEYDQQTNYNKFKSPTTGTNRLLCKMLFARPGKRF
jgi:hypothetical protein